jgi:hypothetical protein
VVDVGQPLEGSSVNLPQEAEPGSNETFSDHGEQLGCLEDVTAASLPGEVETSHATEGPSGSTDLRPKAISEPMAVEPSTNSPTLDSEAAELGNQVGFSQQDQILVGVVEVRWRWIERIAP